MQNILLTSFLWHCFYIGKIIGGTAQQSSTFKTDKYLVADLAIDNNFNQSVGFGSCSHTNNYNEIEWWQVTYDKDILLESVVIYNRVEIGSDLTHRLSDASILVYNNRYQHCADLGNMQDIVSKKVFCSKILRGKTIRILQTQTYTAVTLCEFEAYGKFA